DALGDLASDTVRLLKQIGSNGSTVDTTRLASEFDRRRMNLKPGTILTREWNGQRHRVVETDAGLACNGRTDDSLAKIARAITRSEWNGPRFFGLRDKASTETNPGRRQPLRRCAAPSIPGFPRKPAWTRTSIRWMRNMMRRKPIFAARLMPAGR